MIEEWRAIPGYEGYYEVSNLGKVRSVERDVIGHNQFTSFTIHKKPKMMSLHTGPDGYVRIILFKYGSSKTLLVHRLVASAFLDNPDCLPEVNHKDRNKSNNCIENLEWCSKIDNMQHALSNGWDPGSLNRGRKFTEAHKLKMSEALKGRVFSEEQKQKLKRSHVHQQKPVRCIEDDIVFHSRRAAAEYYNIDDTTVCTSANSHKTTHIGKTFCNVDL